MLVNDLASRHQIWVFGHGHAARLIWNWAVAHFGESVQGFICHPQDALSSIHSKEETLLTSNDTVLIASQFFSQIVARLKGHCCADLFDVRHVLKSLMETYQNIDFALIRDCYPPFSLKVYKQTLLEMHQSTEFCSYDAVTLNTVKARSFHRYDIDTVACCENVQRLTDVALSIGITPAIFIRTDGIDYQPDRMIDFVTQYRELGCDFGLHTSCYALSDSVAALEFELSEFMRCFGARPRGLTVHGLGDQFSERRAVMGRYIADNVDQLDIGYADIPSRFRQHQYVIQDCHFDSSRSTRQLKHDFLAVPEIASNHIDILLLVHPCYWAKD
ncbi:hypothetical protein [Alteromonas oceanisediminis]|uniref:hypothetical protein n=1 Tax=Alteromonas oceanisediminis TaxID=2836180 RepID=UPI001BD9EE3A|nr:hypothetical protein [Alteromonas oceanisediminis]MBT0584935.1 hypothetical protein [Alteromonas oceanisediminis]